MSYFLSFLTRKKEEKWLFLKDALWGGQGKGWLGGERLGGYPPELAWWTGPELAWLRGQGRLGKAGWVPTRAGLVDGGSGRRGKGSGGVQGASVPGGVSGSNVCRIFSNAYKKKKNGVN